MTNTPKGDTLKAALTDFRCCSYADIAQAAGWSVRKVREALES